MAKSKQAMSKPNAKPEKVMGRNISGHTQNRLVERNIPPSDLIHALKKAEHKTPVKDRPSGASYEHHGKRVTAVMTPDGKTVKTVYPLDPRDAKKYHIDYEPLSNQNKADPKVKARMDKAQPNIKEMKPKYKSKPTKNIRANYKRR